MAQRSRFWDGTTIGDATVAPYDAGTEFSEVMTAVAGLVVNPNKGGPVTAVSITTPSAGTVRLAPLEAIVYGAWYQNDANIDFVVATPAAATRIDVLVLRKSWATQTVRAFVITGTEGGAQPSLVQTVGVTWDVPIASISTTTAGAITLVRMYERADLWYRTSADNIETDNNIGIFTAPLPSPNQHALVSVGTASVFVGSYAGGNPNTIIATNTQWVSGVSKPVVPNFPGAQITLYNGEFIFYSTPAVAAGVTQTFPRRFLVTAAGGAAFYQPNTSNSVQVVGDNGSGTQASGLTLKGDGRVECYTNVQLAGPINVVGMYAHAGGSRMYGLIEYVWNSGSDYIELGRDYGWGTKGIIARGGVLFGGYGQAYAVSGATPIITGQAGGFLLLGQGHNGSAPTGNAISVAPNAHNATHLGWGDRGWALVHSVGGVVLDSFEDAKQDFSYLDPTACVEAVLNTDWMAFEYKPPVEEELSRPESMNDEDWQHFQSNHAAMLEEAAIARKQRGYVLASNKYRVHSLFGMENRRNASPQSDLATVACALQAALKKIDAQQAQLDALTGKVN
jgi:hypothetical protein